MKLSHAFIILLGTAVLFIFSGIPINVSGNGQIVVCRGEILQISARLLMNGTYGDPAQGQIIEFFDETNDCYIDSARTDLDGYACIDWYLPLSYRLGLTIVNATFRGNDTCALTPSYQQTSVIIQASTYLDIKVERIDLVPGDEMIFTILLTDDNTNFLCNESLEVFCGPTFLSSGKTNDTGHAKFLINCNQSWENLGLNNITVIYKGNSQEFFAPSEGSFLININKIETVIETNHQIPYYIALNDSIDFSLILKANDIPLENASIGVWLNNEKFTNLITNESGISLLPLIINDEFILGPHKLKFEYVGTERYNYSFCVVDFIVISPAITKVELLTNCIIGEYSLVRIYLFDILYRPIQNASIILTDSMTNQSFLQTLQSDANFSDFHLHIEEPKGVRNYGIEIIGNEYIYNKTNSFFLSIWTQPFISLINSSVTSYASPGQIITLELRLSDSNRNYSNKIITIISNNEFINISSLTNQYGIFVVNLSVPIQEGKWELSIIYEGDESEYELSAYYLYTFFVTQVMPVKVELQQYYVIPSLQQIELNLKIIALNGSALENIALYYEWLNRTGYVVSSQGGYVSLWLSMPSEKGLYRFSYYTTSSSSLQSCNGSIIIAINEQDAVSSQGVGITSIIICIGLSLGIVSIPRLIRRRMIGL